ncbi:MAG: neutral zinc metallopeptidase [Pseudomonadota bacterium]
MVQWRGRRQSTNVEDARGAAGAAAGGGVILIILRLVIGRFGIRGVVFLVAGFFILTAVGVDPMALLQGQTATRQASRAPAADDDDFQFVGVILAETENTWEQIFAENGARYAPPTLKLYTGEVRSACGAATSAAGPFYCPADQKVYLDTSFFRELSQRFGAPGDFAGAYVIAHEVGHHIQTITGTSGKVRQAQRLAGQAESNALQVRMELQADCYAGVWAHDADFEDRILEAGDIEEGLRAAAAIGDDTLQRNAGRRVTPESFTHGTSEQRQRWFYAGYQSGDVNACDTFADRAL